MGLASGSNAGRVSAQRSGPFGDSEGTVKVETSVEMRSMKVLRRALNEKVVSSLGELLAVGTLSTNVHCRARVGRQVSLNLRLMDGSHGYFPRRPARAEHHSVVACLPAPRHCHGRLTST